MVLVGSETDDDVSHQAGINVYKSFENGVQDKLGGVTCKCGENIPRIIVHGGAGSFDDSILIEKLAACKKAASNGYKKLLNGESAVEAVESALWWLECDEFFNAGYGSVLNGIGKVQMDASIMDGSTFTCGSVAAVSDIEHPISLAKYVMQHFPNYIFVGEGAKNLAKHADLNWISDGNMVSPMAYIAYKLGKSGAFEADCEIETLKCADTLTNSFGTVGCVAYDGQSIVAGTTTGGLNKKLVGRVGDSPILGCGTYADKNVGCSLTGHGESIMKLSLSRVIAQDIERNLTAQEALEQNLISMLNKFEQTGGGIVLQSNGLWAVHFTSDKMPYALIEDDLIMFGAKLNDTKVEVYHDPDSIRPSTEQGLLDSKLFSFREWQRYIECRKTILVHSHFPTKLKYSPNTHGIDSLYIKFLEFVNAKGEREEPEINNPKRFLPEELVAAMKKYIINLCDNDMPLREVDLFPPSLTPLHSYLQQLLDDPLSDFPNIVRNDFFHTKVSYMTKPNYLMDLARRCNIEINIIDSSVHFLEKIVPPFEQTRMPSVENYKQLVEIEDDIAEGHMEKSENLNDYIHRKIPCEMRLNARKQQYYNTLQSSVKSSEKLLESDIIFTDVLPNGRLAIPTDNDSESTDNPVEGARLEGSKFCDQYNLRLSTTERESILRPGIIERLRAKKKLHTPLTRNTKGQFVKDCNPIKVEDCSSEDEPVSTQNLLSDNTIINNIKTYDIPEKGEMEILFTEEDLGITNIDIETALMDIDHFNFSQISFLCENEIPLSIENNQKDIMDNRMQFFRPFKDYWMYHCIFSRVKSKNFELFEKTLPKSFRFLLNECAHAVEMTTEELYEEVCLIETYHAHILKPTNTEVVDNNLTDPKSKQLLNLILSKW